MITTTTPADFNNPPVSLGEVKSHLGINYAFDDSRILTLIWNAIDWLEQETGRSWCRQSYKWVLDRFPPVLPTYNQWLRNFAQSPLFQYGPWIPMRQRITFPRNPVISVDSIQYYDTNNTLQTLSSSNWVLVTSEIEPAILEATTAFPVTFIRPDAVQITFTAGLNNGNGSGSGSGIQATYPALFQRFICEAVSWLNENREGGNVPASLERAIALLKDGTYV